jgi:broad specificity phosphatase PhoE
MNIYFVRHGESKANVFGNLCGQLNSPLTEVGLQQAKDIGKILKYHNFDECYSSPLSRAYNTAIAIRSGLNIIIADELKEHDTGTYSDILKSEYIENIDFRMDKQYANPDIPFVGGESLNDLKKRTFNWFSKTILQESNIGKEILIVAHNGTINGILCGFFEISMKHFKCFELKNAKYSKLSFRYDTSVGWTGNILEMNTGAG